MNDDVPSTSDLVEQRIEERRKSGDRSLSISDIPNLNEFPGTALGDLSEFDSLDLSGMALENLGILPNIDHVTSLKLNHTSIRNLNLIDRCQNLRQLELSGTVIADLSPLKHLPRLEHLDLSNTPATDLEPLRQLGNLKTLDLSNSKSDNFDALGNLPKIEGLYLSNTRIPTLGPVLGTNKLRVLHVSNAPITDLRALSHLEALDMLDISNTGVVDLEPLSRIEHLSRVVIDRTPISNLAPLQSHKALQFLDFIDTAVSDLLPLQELEDLKRIYFSGTQIDDMRPLLPMDALWEYAGKRDVTGFSYGLRFENTIATRDDPQLGALAKVRDNIDRAARTRAYLQDLPTWPNTYKKSTSSTPTQVANPALVIAETQIENLLSFAKVHSNQARVVAQQIRHTVDTALAPGTNDVPRIMRVAGSMAELLEATGETLENETDQLRQKIAVLEQEIVELTKALQDSEARAEAETALSQGLQSALDSQSESGSKALGYWHNVKLSSAEQTVKLPFFLMKAGILYQLASMLGPSHPMVQTLFKIVEAIAK